MNRLDDLKRTLANNVRVLKDFSSHVELVIACFDKSSNCEEWVRLNFRPALKAGSLRFLRFPPLPYWHFSKAKNSFVGRIRGSYYSSLDGDNFLSRDEVDLTLKIVRDRSRDCLIHHFSGHWGDGSSGRVTLPTELYERSPYIEEIFPRQFDEIGLILRMLTEYPWLTFFSRPDRHVFSRSQSAREFARLNRLYFRHLTLDLGNVERPVNPRGEGYLDRDGLLLHFQNVNAAYSLLQLSQTEESKQTFAGSLRRAQNALIQSDSCKQALPYWFSGRDLSRLKRSGKLTLYAVVRDDAHFLPSWLTHYRSLGVERFIIVDDHSETPLYDRFTDSDVYVLTPEVGTFRSSKVAWLHALMKCFQDIQSWVLTVDADEFIDIPSAASNIRDGRSALSVLTDRLDSLGCRYLPGLLHDLMPASTTLPVTPSTFVETMIYQLYRPSSRDSEYQDYEPVRWAFGRWWRYSFDIDLRYRLFGTLDCLRKIPLIRYDDDIELNQGFHTLTVGSHSLSAEDVWAKPAMILPIRHYKMLNVFCEDLAASIHQSRMRGYFGRTQANLTRIYNSDRDRMRDVWQLTPFKERYRPDRRILPPSRPTVRYPGTSDMQN